jgi:hypothetical protein
MRVRATKTLTCLPSELTVATLTQFLEQAAGDAIVDVEFEEPDRPGYATHIMVTVSEIEGNL